ncbi:MAG: UTP--glucose-1-phosphate uridylyltransferase GalU [Candidatus Paracaedimonas acanthamoebae]|uniref:UTP--glucose-1-phosphate uridylyltransferase n=1 Tax=Candidatus Paracaedimonas acanthamoebae TaxID=244581 RepID=A0A8J7PMU7_9PROT|nr:UTP--glucose-1-phosphate uridylyltransferase GalU [Candidatus Paracaedimonas acanthamoebae]
MKITQDNILTTKVRKAVFPVGGLGTRFLPVTKAMPKEMLPVVDKPLIQYAVEEAAAAGIEEFIFVTGRGKTAIEDHFDHSFELEHTLRQRGKEEEYQSLNSLIKLPGSISYIRQQEPLGLGHAVWCARHLIGNEPFAILLADDFIYAHTPCLKQMIDAYEGGVMVAVMDVEPSHVNRYGIIDIQEEHQRQVKVKAVIEKPSPDQAPSHLAIIGRYILDSEVFQHLEKQERGAGGEIQLTDALSPMIQKMPFNGYRFEGTRYDCGSRGGLLAASITVALDREDLRDEVLNELFRVMPHNINLT